MTHRRISTRFLGFFKVLTYVLLFAASAAALVVLWVGDLLAAFMPINAGIIAFVTIRGMRKLRTVTWEGTQLLVEDQANIIILPEEIKSIELKMLIGVHEVTLNEPHPYLGESFLFLASMKYLVAHDKIDDQMHQLREYIAQSKRKLMF